MVFLYHFYLGFILLNQYSIANCNDDYIKLSYSYGLINNKIFIWLTGYPKVLLFSIDMNSNQTWLIAPLNPEFNISSIVHQSTVSSLEQDDSGEKEIELSFNLGNVNKSLVINTPCFYKKSNCIINYQGDGILALPYHFEDTSKSFVHLMQSQGLINQLSFAFTQRDLYFGGIDPKEIKNKYYSYCNVIGVNSRWDCSLSKVMIQNETIVYSFVPPMKSNSSHAYFDNENNKIYAPKEFIDLLIAFYQKFIDTNDCIVLNIHNEERQLYCRDSDALQTGNVTFFIEDYAYTINMKLLWTCFDFETHCDCDIVENSIDNSWNLGSDFYLMNIVQFDYDNKKVHFYSKNGVKFIKNLSNINHYQIILICAAMIILLVGLFQLEIIHQRKHINYR